jgi:hypothetical protein
MIQHHHHHMELTAKVLDALRRNDPTVKDIAVPAVLQNQDRTVRTLGRSLEGNTQVTDLDIDVSGLTDNESLTPLLDFVQHSRTLRSISLDGLSITLLETSKVLARFFEAIGNNPSIHSFKLCYSELTVPAFCTLLRSTECSLRRVDLRYCHVEPSAVTELALALGANNSITDLFLFSLEEAFVVPILLQCWDTVTSSMALLQWTMYWR